MSDQPEKAEKIRVSVTFQRAHLDTFDHLIDEGLYADHQDVIRDAVRIFFRLYELEPWTFSEELPEKGREDLRRVADGDVA